MISHPYHSGGKESSEDGYEQQGGGISNQEASDNVMNAAGVIVIITFVGLGLVLLFGLGLCWLTSQIERLPDWAQIGIGIFGILVIIIAIIIIELEEYKTKKNKKKMMGH